MISDFAFIEPLRYGFEIWLVYTPNHSFGVNVSPRKAEQTGVLKSRIIVGEYQIYLKVPFHFQITYFLRDIDT